MWYYFYMNKDVIYIEPDDDITDIITKIETAKEKIVALVPPKKAGVFRSVVNIKLIAKAALGAKKTVVLVTVDPSIIKLAAMTKLPVAKDLNSAPAVVEAGDDEVDDEDDIAADDDIDEDVDEDSEDDEATEEDEDAEDEQGKEEEDDDEEEKEEKPEKSKKKRGKPVNKVIDWIVGHKVLSISGGVLSLGLIALLIWMFGFAPAVDVFVSIKTDTNNFSEAVSFVNEQGQEDIKEGKLYLEERKIETLNEVEFEATGQKNVGERATGELVIYSYFSAKGSNAVNAGTTFTINGLSYVASEDKTLTWDGNGKKCENEDYLNDGKIQCLISGRIKVSAAEPGSKYNIAKSSTGWTTIANVAAYSDKEMAGGTDSNIVVVQQLDIENARNGLNSDNEAENKKKLYDTITDDNLIIESTFKQETSTAVATPGADEEVKEGVKPTLKATTTTSVYIIDKIKLEELIRAKVDLPASKKIFEIRNVYIDGFKETDGGFTGKLKAVYFTGPRITETELVDKIMGKGIGDAKREIKDIEGVSDVKIEPSYPWVWSVPNNSNRISVTFEIKDQDGQKIEEKPESKTEEKSEEGAEEKIEETEAE